MTETYNDTTPTMCKAQSDVGMNLPLSYLASVMYSNLSQYKYTLSAFTNETLVNVVKGLDPTVNTSLSRDELVWAVASMVHDNTYDTTQRFFIRDLFKGFLHAYNWCYLSMDDLQRIAQLYGVASPTLDEGIHELLRRQNDIMQELLDKGYLHEPFKALVFVHDILTTGYRRPLSRL